MDDTRCIFVDKQDLEFMKNVLMKNGITFSEGRAQKLLQIINLHLNEIRRNEEDYAEGR